LDLEELEQGHLPLELMVLMLVLMWVGLHQVLGRQNS
jgi:hypothetical protein